jgi:hypothetical protein
MQPNTDNMPPQRETISLEEAQKRCQLWMNKWHELVPDSDIIQAPKAIWFHWADIEQIVNDFRPYYPVDGVRVYFAMTEKGGPYQIKGLMVPTIPAADGSGKSNDLVIKVPIVPRPHPGGGDGLMEDEGDSIYDFTRPCPAFCNEGLGERSIY